MKIKVSPKKLAALLTEVYERGETAGYMIAESRDAGKDRLMRAIREEKEEGDGLEDWEREERIAKERRMADDARSTEDPGESPASAAVRREMELEAEGRYPEYPSAYASDSGSWGPPSQPRGEIGWPHSGPIVTRHMLRQDVEELRGKLAEMDARLVRATRNQEQQALAIGDRDDLIADLRLRETEQAGTIAILREDGNLAAVEAARHKAAQLEEDKGRLDEEIGRLRQFYAQAQDNVTDFRRTDARTIAALETQIAAMTEATKTLDGSPAGIFIRAVSAMEEVEGAAYGMLHRIDAEAVSVRRALAGQQTGGAWVDFDPLPRLIVIASNAFGLFLHFHEAQANDRPTGPGALAVPDGRDRVD